MTDLRPLAGLWVIVIGIITLAVGMVHGPENAEAIPYIGIIGMMVFFVAEAATP